MNRGEREVLTFNECDFQPPNIQRTPLTFNLTTHSATHFPRTLHFTCSAAITFSKGLCIRILVPVPVGTVVCKKSEASRLCLPAHRHTWQYFMEIYKVLGLTTGDAKS